MVVSTKFLGDIEIEEKDMVYFEYGLPGFAELHKFVLLLVEGNPSLYYMQSLEESKVCFVVINSFMIIEDYQVDISEETILRLEIEKAEDVSLYSILTIPEDMKDITANLLAPIVINNVNNKAYQEILNDERYSVKYKLYRGE